MTDAIDTEGGFGMSRLKAEPCAASTYPIPAIYCVGSAVMMHGNRDGGVRHGKGNCVRV